MNADSETVKLLHEILEVLIKIDKKLDYIEISASTLEARALGFLPKDLKKPARGSRSVRQRR
jgi:hypothetical protein